MAWRLSVVSFGYCWWRLYADLTTLRIFTILFFGFHFEWKKVGRLNVSEEAVQQTSNDVRRLSRVATVFV
jgi:hypothetical protein